MIPATQQATIDFFSSDHFRRLGCTISPLARIIPDRRVLFVGPDRRNPTRYCSAHILPRAGKFEAGDAEFLEPTIVPQTDPLQLRVLQLRPILAHERMSRFPIGRGHRMLVGRDQSERVWLRCYMFLPPELRENTPRNAFRSLFVIGRSDPFAASLAADMVVACF